MATRLDTELVRRGLARSRAVARDLVAAGRVDVDGRPARRAATPVDDRNAIAVAGEQPGWVGRGAGKLEAALAQFGRSGLTVEGRRVIDGGASTGGFTQVLLRHGAATVAAVDVGHGQLAAQLRADDRVADYSGVSVRGLDPDRIGGPGDLLVADLSFISLTTVIADLARLVTPAADLLLLVKPQFEVGRERLGKSGVVRDPRDRLAALGSVAQAAQEAGLAAAGLMRSPMTGGRGNIEYLLWLRRVPAGEAVGIPWQALEEQARFLITQESS